MTPSHPEWLPTGQAALHLGVSSCSLKRYADRDESLIDGQHWRRGPHANSPRVWNIPACEEALHWRGRGGRRRQGLTSAEAHPSNRA